MCLKCAQSLSPRRRGMPSCRVTRPKGEPISRKSGHRSIFLTKSHRQPPVFDAIRCKISLDKPKVVPLYFRHEKGSSYQTIFWAVAVLPTFYPCKSRAADKLAATGYRIQTNSLSRNYRTAFYHCHNPPGE